MRDKASRLDKFCDHINRCDVIIEHPNHSQHSGSPYRVRIDVTASPNHELVADEKPIKHEMHEAALPCHQRRFQTMERQLKELTDRQHNKVKHHGGQLSAAEVGANSVSPQE